MVASLYAIATEFRAVVADLLPYLPAALGALFINGADIYFLQSELKPPLHRSPSFWVYLLGHLTIALLAAWFLYSKASVPHSDWPIVAVISTLTGFSVVQSFTLKLGGNGVDAREMFDQWKRRVLEDVIKINVSNTRIRQSQTATRLASSLELASLEASVRFLAADVQSNPEEVLARARTGGAPSLMMAQYIASADLAYAESLLTNPEAAKKRGQPV